MSRGTVLIIDDNPNELERVSTVLEGQGGYKCLAFTDPREGLAKALQNDIELIILDVKMPRMSGLTLALSIREAELKTPIVFYSGGIDDAQLAQISQIEYSRVYSKTESMDGFIGTCRSAIAEAWSAKKITELKDGVGSIKAQVGKLFATTRDLSDAQTSLTQAQEETNTVLDRIEEKMITVDSIRSAIDTRIQEVASALGKPDEDLADEGLEEVVRQSRTGMAMAIVREVDAVAFTDFLNRILKSKVFWLLFTMCVSGFTLHVQTLASMSESIKTNSRASEASARSTHDATTRVEKVELQYQALRAEQTAIRDDVKDIKKLLQRSTPPSPGP